MPFEIVPFICGFLLCWWRPLTNRNTVISAIIVGVFCAAAAGELALSWPLPLLAIGVDSLAAVAGCFAARLIIHRGSPAGRT